MGVLAVYTAGSISLAILEMLVHGEPPLAGYVVIPVAFDSAMIEAVKVGTLPAGWNAYPAPAAVVRIGDEWLRARRTVVLRVPSAVVPSESNFLLNPAHPGFSKLVIGDPVDHRMDLRFGDHPRSR